MNPLATILGGHAPRLALLASLSLAAAGSLSAQSILYVDGRKPGGAGTSWAAAFNKVEDAVDAARSSRSVQEIWVAFGTYQLGKTLDLRAGVDLIGGFRGAESQRNQRVPGAPQLTVLDIGGQGRVLQLESSATSADEVIGFTIRGAKYQGSGGGIYCYGGSPTLSELIIENNQVSPSSTFGSANGAGAYFYSGSPVLSDVVFRFNSAQGSGGGLYAYSGDPKLTDCYFVSNETLPPNTFQSGRGAGMYCYEGDPVLKGVVFRKNNTDGDGGGFYGYSGSPSFEDCIFEFNQAESLAGAADYEGAPSFDRCVFRGNTNRKGAGSPILRSYKGSLSMIGSIVAGNDGDGLALLSAGSLDLVNVTIAGNTGVGLSISGSAKAASLVNSIVWANAGGAFSGAPMSVNYSCIQGGFSGNNNTSKDPLLLNAASGNVRISAGSSCFNSGDNTAIKGAVLDFEMQPRVFAGTVDIGADEFVPAARFHHADLGRFSLSAGGTVNYSVLGSGADAGSVFVLMPSLEGARPSLPLGGFTVPIAFDTVSTVLISALAPSLIGVLDAQGRGQSALSLPPLPSSGLEGLVISTAPVFLDASRGIYAAGNDEHVQFVQ
jgi:hypothetical protein